MTLRDFRQITARADPKSELAVMADDKVYELKKVLICLEDEGILLFCEPVQKTPDWKAFAAQMPDHEETNHSQQPESQPGGQSSGPVRLDECAGQESGGAGRDV